MEQKVVTFEQEIDRIFDYMVSKNGNALGVPEICMLVVSAMQILRDYRNFSGLQKKQILVRAVKKLVEASNVENKEFLQVFVDQNLPFLIDTFFWISVHKVKFKDIKSCSCIGL